MTGLYPFNPLADTWEQAIEALGIVKNLNLKKENNNRWEIQVIRKDEDRH